MWTQQAVEDVIHDLVGCDSFGLSGVDAASAELLIRHKGELTRVLGKIYMGVASFDRTVVLHVAKEQGIDLLEES